MANYSLVINSKFRPFEFSEMIQPVMIAEQAHKELEDAYGELAAKANIWDKMTNPETDKRAHSIYEAYARDLEKQAEELAKYGLTPTSRQSMIDMKGRYSKDITPIETAYRRRAEQAKQQAEIMAKDPTHFFARNAAETSLDRYLENPNLDTINQNYSGAVLAKQVSDEAAALAKAARNDPKVRTQLRHLLGFNYETIRQTGFSPEAVREAILRSPNASKELMNIVDNAMSSSGIADWDYVSPEEKQRIWDKALSYANQGLWSAVGQTQYGTVVDDRAKAAYESALAEQRARNAFRREHPNGIEGPTSGGINIVPIALRGANEIDARNKQIQNYIKRGYFERTSNGGYKLTPEGIKAYNTRANFVGSGRYARRTNEASEFKKFMDEENGGRAIIENGKYVNGITGPGAAGNLFSRAISRSKEGSYDIYHSTEYRYPLGTETEQKAFKDNLLAVIGPSGIEEVDYDGKSGSFKGTGNKFKTTDLSGYTPIEIRPHNNRKREGDDTIIWADKDGNTLRTKVPASVNLWASANNRQIIEDANLFGEIADSKYLPMYNEVTHSVMRDAQGQIIWSPNIATELDKQKAAARQREYLEELILSTANFNTRFSTKPVELNFTPR